MSAPPAERRRLDPASVFLIAEEVREPAEEGYDKMAVELARALGRRSDVRLHITPATPGPARGLTAARRSARRMLALLSPRLHLDLRRRRPEVLVYLSRTSTTGAALARCRLLRLAHRRRPLVMVALQQQAPGRLGPLTGRLRPDLLLVGSSLQLAAARRLAASVACLGGGVDLERFRPATAVERARLRRKWGVEEKPPVVLHVGHLTSGRNLEALVQLAAGSGLRVIVAASSQVRPETPALREMLRKAAVRVYHGFLPNIEELYRLADVYVFPTLSTDHAIGFPLSVLEAMACGLPVAATRFGALPDRFEGAPGVQLVDDPAELRVAVERLLADPVSTRPLAEAYSWDAVADALLEALPE